jgi:hypothetical protein
MENEFIEWAYFNRDTGDFLHTASVPGLKDHCSDIVEIGLTEILDYSYRYTLVNGAVVKGEQYPASPMLNEE